MKQKVSIIMDNDDNHVWLRMSLLRDNKIDHFKCKKSKRSIIKITFYWIVGSRERLSVNARKQSKLPNKKPLWRVKRSGKLAKEKFRILLFCESENHVDSEWRRMIYRLFRALKTDVSLPNCGDLIFLKNSRRKKMPRARKGRQGRLDEDVTGKYRQERGL